MGKNKKANHSKREEEKANKIVKGIFIALIVLALITMVGRFLICQKKFMK